MMYYYVYRTPTIHDRKPSKLLFFSKMSDYTINWNISTILLLSEDACNSTTQNSTPHQEHYILGYQHFP